MNETFQVKRLGQYDTQVFRQLIQLFEEVFETAPISTTEENYLARLLEKKGFIAYAAFAGTEIAGGLTAYELPKYYSEESEIFIYDIAVKPIFQRKGLGKQLLATLKNYCRENSIKTMFVAANEEDEQALDFYHSTGGDAEKVIHFNYTLDKK